MTTRGDVTDFDSNRLELVHKPQENAIVEAMSKQMLNQIQMFKRPSVAAGGGSATP